MVVDSMNAMIDDENDEIIFCFFVCRSVLAARTACSRLSYPRRPSPLPPPTPSRSTTSTRPCFPHWFVLCCNRQNRTIYEIRHNSANMSSRRSARREADDDVIVSGPRQSGFNALCVRYNAATHITTLSQPANGLQIDD